MDCSPDALIQAAMCFRCAPNREIRSYLLCQWTGATLCEAEALTYIAAAGITNPTEILAVCQLVADLKNNGSPSFWSRDLIIYPMLGGAYGGYNSCRVNLKTPGTYDFTEVAGHAATYTARGVKGNKTAGSEVALDTALVPNVTDPLLTTDMRAMCYVDVVASKAAAMMFGVSDAAAGVGFRAYSNADAADFRYDANETMSGRAIAGAAPTAGIKFIQHQAGNSMSAYAAGVWQILVAIAPVGINAFSVYLLSQNQGGTRVNESDAVISGFSLGTAFTEAEKVAYRAIWEQFQSTLGRTRP